MLNSKMICQVMSNCNIFAVYCDMLLLILLYYEQWLVKETLLSQLTSSFINVFVRSFNCSYIMEMFVKLGVIIKSLVCYVKTNSLSNSELSSFIVDSTIKNNIFHSKLIYS